MIYDKGYEAARRLLAAADSSEKAAKNLLTKNSTMPIMKPIKRLLSTVEANTALQRNFQNAKIQAFALKQMYFEKASPVDVKLSTKWIRELY